MTLIFTFSVPSFVGQTDEARRVKGWREFEKIMREGVWWFGSEDVKGLLKKITTHPKPGRPPARINERILEEYDAAVRDAAPKRMNKAEFGRLFYEKYHVQYDLQSPEAVTKQLNRLLKKRPQNRPQGQK